MVTASLQHHSCVKLLAVVGIVFIFMVISFITKKSLTFCFFEANRSIEYETKKNQALGRFQD